MGNKDWLENGVDGLTFGERLEDLIKERNETQMQTAMGAGLKQSHISRYVRGVSAPDASSLIALADHFGISVDYLMGRTNVRSADSNSQAVCAFTGLSEYSVSWLHDLQIHIRNKPDNREGDYNLESIALYMIEDYIRFASSPNLGLDHYVNFLSQRFLHEQTSEQVKTMAEEECKNFVRNMMKGYEAAMTGGMCSIPHEMASVFFRSQFLAEYEKYLSENYPLTDSPFLRGVIWEDIDGIDY